MTNAEERLDAPFSEIPFEFGWPMEIIKFRSQLVAALEPVRVSLRLAQETLTKLAGSVVDRRRALQEAVLTRKNDLRKLLASFLDAMVVANSKVVEFRSQLVAALEPVKVSLRLRQATLTKLAGSVVDRRRALQQAVLTKENDLRKLLVSSLDAIVITDVDGRFISANSHALNLFGVSETNMRRFTIDIFLSQDQTPYIAGHGSSFIRREKRHGECKIRRLDGSLRVADYVLLAHFLPNWYVCRFCNIKTARVKSFATINSGNGNDSKLVRQCLESRGRKI